MDFDVSDHSLSADVSLTLGESPDGQQSCSDLIGKRDGSMVQPSMHSWDFGVTGRHGKLYKQDELSKTVRASGFFDMKEAKRLRLASDAGCCYAVMPPASDPSLFLGLGSEESAFDNVSSSASSSGPELKGISQNGPLVDLALGLATPTVKNVGIISGAESVVTSIGPLYLNQYQMARVGYKFPIVQDYSQYLASNTGGTAESMTSVFAATFDSARNDPEMQLCLGFSSNSGINVTHDHISNTPFSCAQSNALQDIRLESSTFPVVDEGSTSARSRKCGGHIASLLMGHKLDSSQWTGVQNIQQTALSINENPAMDTPTTVDTLELDNSMNLKGSSGATSTSGASGGFSDKPAKVCKFKGCGKRARGASHLCIAHGGGSRCQKPGCNKGAEGRTIFCKAHGGGRRCESLGCTKSAEGKTDFCIAHGGGRRCSHDGCTKAARGRSGLCIRHGGGKRCQKEGCTKSAEGYSGLCISHGGGRRCQYPGCGKGAQGSTMFCKAHGGGKRCIAPGCSKGAEGSTSLCKGHGGGKRCLFDGGGVCNKSVHGGTSYCVAHGGGKRCAVQGCTKSARGKTDYCVRHGGGKRCRAEDCSKSAQGSTDFCKAHGGGKRCLWGQEGSPFSAELFQGKLGDFSNGPCDRYARGKLGLCAAHSGLVHDQRVHGAGTLGDAIPQGLDHRLAYGILARSDSSKQFTPIIDDDYVNNSQSGGSDSAMQVSTSNGSSGEEEKMDDDIYQRLETCQMPLGAAGDQDMGLASYDSNKLVDVAAWKLHPSNLPYGQHSSPSQVEMKKAFPEAGFRYHHPGLPAWPMQRVPYQRKHVEPLSTNDETIFNMSSLSLPDERVHGGNIMAWLSNEARQKDGL